MRNFILISIVGSMALGAIPVKAHAENPAADVKLTNSSAVSNGESAKGHSKSWQFFVRAVMDSCDDFYFRNGYAQAIGLPGPMPSKRCHISIGAQNDIVDDRDAHVVYSLGSTGSQNKMSPAHVYLQRGHSSNHNVDQRFFLVSLDGKLERVITLQSKTDDNGKGLKEGRSRTEEDTNNSEIMKIFNTEATYWLNDWLMKQHHIAHDTTKPTPDANTATPMAR